MKKEKTVAVVNVKTVTLKDDKIFNKTGKIKLD